MGGWGYDGFLTRVALPGNVLAGLSTTWTARWGNVDWNETDAAIAAKAGVTTQAVRLQRQRRRGPPAR